MGFEFDAVVGALVFWGEGLYSADLIVDDLGKVLVYCLEVWVSLLMIRPPH